MAKMRVLLIVVIASMALWGQGPDPAALRKYVQDGERALGEGRYAEAEAAFEKLRQMDPGTAEIHAKLGVIYYQQRKYEKAVPVLRQALKLKPGLPNLDVLLAMSLAELGRHAEALAGLEKGFRKSADLVLKRMAGLQLQRSLTALRKDSQAVEVSLELFRIYPDDAEVLYHTGRLFGNFAYLAMRQLAAVAPDSGWRHLAAGEAHEAEGNFALSAGEYREVMRVEPGRPGMHYRLGRVLLAAKDEAAARQEFGEELKGDPTNANAAYEAGEIDRKAGRLEAARELFAQAVKLDGEFQEARVGLGRSLIALGKAGEALAHLKKAAALDPADEIPPFHLAQVYRAAGDTAGQQRALAEFRRLRAAKGDGRPAAGPRREVTRQEASGEGEDRR